MKSTLSVIIPVYNTEKYLNRCLNSVINQTYKNLEIIIINDGSTDSSLSICKEAEKKDSRIMVINNTKRGVSSARNCGLNKAKGDYITFVDSDDYLEPDAYEKAFNNVGDCDAVFFGYFEDFESQNQRIPISPSKTGIVNPYEAIYNCMLPIRFYYCTSIWNKIFKKEKISDVRFDESLCIGEDDVWLVQSILKLSKIMLVNEPLYNYVQRQESAIHSIEKLSHNWLPHITAKEKVIQLVSNNEECYYAAIAKQCNDLFCLYVNSYLIDGYDESRIVFERIKKYKNQFLKTKEFSYRRKIKYMLLSLLIQIRTPKKWIAKIWDVTTYRVIQYIKNGKTDYIEI